MTLNNFLQTCTRWHAFSCQSGLRRCPRRSFGSVLTKIVGYAWLPQPSLWLPATTKQNYKTKTKNKITNKTEKQNKKLLLTAVISVIPRIFPQLFQTIDVPRAEAPRVFKVLLKLHPLHWEGIEHLPITNKLKSKQQHIKTEKQKHRTNENNTTNNNK